MTKKSFPVPGVIAGLFLYVGVIFCGGPARAGEPPHPLIPEYSNLLVTYACQAKELWHAAPDGGYWGDRLDAKDQNGAVRGSANTLLTYAMLIHALDNDWMNPKDVKTLTAAGLGREQMLELVRLNLAYLTAHHKSAPGATAPQWGYGWQTPLWLQAMGMAALLEWKELGDGLRQDVKRVAAAEADWVASRPPKDFANGDTGAEENAWNTAAPALALALQPQATSATAWARTLKSYAVNTYSRQGEKGEGQFAELVSTGNLNADWSLVNHHFFHPDYLQVSGMHLGEAWLILKLGDGINGTQTAEEFAPFGLYNVAEVWRHTMRPLLLPTGEFAYPAGNDWTFHCSTNQGYFAYIATALDDYDAAEAEARGLEHLKNRREVSPPGRLLGDSNLEYWWEPLVCKRMCTAMLLHEMRPGVVRRLEPSATVDALTTTTEFPAVDIWLHRTPDYFFSISAGKTRLGYFVPMGDAASASPYNTLPMKDGLVPPGEWKLKKVEPRAGDLARAVEFEADGVTTGAALCMERSVVLFTRGGLGPLFVENDSLTAPGRTVETDAARVHIPMLKKVKPAWLPGPWINVDNCMGLVCADGFTWKPGCRWTQRSVAVDRVTARSKAGLLQLMAADNEGTREVARTMAVETFTTGVEALVQDGRGGARYRCRLADDGFTWTRQ